MRTNSKNDERETLECKLHQGDDYQLSVVFRLLSAHTFAPSLSERNFGATKDVIGIVLSGYTVAALIIRPFSGYVVDSFSRKKVLMVCLTAFAIFFAGYIAASTILMFAICRTLHGGPFGAVTVANSTCAIDVLPASRRNEGIGLYGLSNNLPWQLLHLSESISIMR